MAQSWLNNIRSLLQSILRIYVIPDRGRARYIFHLTRAVARPILPYGRHGFMRGLFSGTRSLAVLVRENAGWQRSLHTNSIGPENEALSTLAY
jgi:hypothetical protein